MTQWESNQDGLLGDIGHPQLERLSSSRAMHRFGSPLQSNAHVNCSHYLGTLAASVMLSALHAYSYISSQPLCEVGVIIASVLIL